ncbi:MAG: hypothetical protein JXB05_39090 [Myxococcaceae bacterium]|nr:hypothetical protein [Myxococcaceae bacterium]
MTRAALLLLGLLLSAQALAQSPTLAPEVPGSRLLINNLIAVRLNPLGLENQTRAGYQSVLYRNEGALFRDNFLFLGASSKLSPAAIKAGPTVEFQPLSVFNLRLTAEYVAFFSTYGYVQSRPSPNAEYSDTLLEAGDSAGQNYAASGAHFMLEPLVQLKVGPIAVRNRFSLEYWSMGLREGDRVWYDGTLDTLVPGKGFTYGNELDILYLGRSPLVVGARYSLVKPLYRARHFAAGEVESENNSHHRVGLLAAYVFWDEGYTAFNKPAVLLNVAWYLRHRYRTGAEVSQAVPYVVLGFAFQSDLLDGK